MNVISKILGRLGYKRSTTSNPAQWFIDWVTGGGASSAGVNVNAQSALKYTPFWAAVRIISGTIASLPFKVYSRRADGGKDPKPGHRVYGLIHNRPNEYMDALTFIETRQAQVLTYGNSYAEIQRDRAGRPIALWPLMPDRTSRKIQDGIPYYEVRPLTGGSINLPDYNVLHIKGLGFDGYTGYDVVSYHKEAIGYGIAVKEYGARLFANDASPGGILEHPATLSDTALAHLKESWAAKHEGLKQSHRMEILEEGMKFNQTGIDPEKAQALEVQKYTVDDCSRIFNIPPHKLGSLERATFNNIEELNLDFVSQTLLYWFRKWEGECDYKLFMPSERGKMFCAILAEGLLRGKTVQRFQAYNVGRNAGFLCVDDIREMENMNPLPDGKGKIFLEPLNMKPAGTEVDGGDDDAVRSAHRALLAGQWLRIINKQNAAIKKVIRSDFYAGHRNYASTVLADSVMAFASTRGISRKMAADVLDSVIDANVKINIQLEAADAERLANMIIEKIGGNHAATKT